MNYNQPMVNDNQCVGMVASHKVRKWLSVPCDQKFSTVLICHQETRMPNRTLYHRGNSSCPYKWFSWRGVCLQLTFFLSPNYNTNKSCELVGNSTLRRRIEALTSLLASVKLNGLYEFDVSVLEDKHLIFYLNVSNANSSAHICVMPPFLYGCSSQQFQWPDGSCVPLAFHCNNITDCTDGSDEADCSWTCTHTPCTNCTWPHCQCANGFYQCESGGCVPADVVCDGIMNCADASDERYCELVCLSGTRPCSDGLLCVADAQWCDGIQHCIDVSGFLCHDSVSCIPNSWLNDGISDCVNGDDEDRHLLPFSDHMQKCTTNNTLQCEHAEKCYQVSDHCLYETKYTGFISFCRRGTHLMDCADFECSSSYKCLGAYCIPYGRLCDGTIDCPDGSDETLCNVSCQGLFICQQEDICLSEYQICNGKIDCRLSGDDEKYCIRKSQNFIDLENNTISSKLLFNTWLHPALQVVQYPSSGIIALENHLAADKQLAIKALDISDNILTELKSMTFWNFQQLRFLFLGKNNIMNIQAFAFHGIANMFILDLSNNVISYLSLHMFDSCTIYNLVLSHNPISQVDHSFFTEVQVGGMLFPATEQMCCMLFEGDLNTSCHIDWHVSVCSDLLVSDVIIYLIWLVCLLCMVSNLFCLYKHYRFEA